MAELTNGTTVLIADGEKALLLTNLTDAQDPHLEVLRKEEQDNPPDRAQGTDRPGRFNDGPSVQRSAVQETDWHALEKERFASDLSDMLFRMAHRGDLNRLIVVAAPRVLGDLRKTWHKEVASKVVGELDKDLTNSPLDEIETILHREFGAKAA
ncbi:host attachment family protein [Mesobacterium pallidum]|uniref:host attachment family protein n=1 Tax=Mesobacterium pallidum TaxID=2872037 RepID=UPI001EE182CF|nr:host attachment family protein [Mesobacterium pallidum]